MKTLIIALLVVLFGFAAQSQNIIVNGTMEPGINNDSLAYPWEVSVMTYEYWIEDGAQYASSPYQAILTQHLNLTGTAGKTYHVEFDFLSNVYTNFCVYWDEGNGYSPLYMLPTATMQHYSFNFYHPNTSLVRIAFVTTILDPWMKVDNVSMIDITTVGIADMDNPGHQNKIEYYDMVGRRIPGIPERGMYVKITNGVGKTHYKIKN
jgi:hypothetical protein